MTMLRMLWRSRLRTARPASDPGRFNGRGLLVYRLDRSVHEGHPLPGACGADDVANYKIDDGSEKISF